MKCPTCGGLAEELLMPGTLEPSGTAACFNGCKFPLNRWPLRPAKGADDKTVPGEGEGR